MPCRLAQRNCDCGGKTLTQTEVCKPQCLSRTETRGRDFVCDMHGTTCTRCSPLHQTPIEMPGSPPNPALLTPLCKRTYLAGWLNPCGARNPSPTSEGGYSSHQQWHARPQKFVDAHKLRVKKNATHIISTGKTKMFCRGTDADT